MKVTPWEEARRLAMISYNFVVEKEGPHFRNVATLPTQEAAFDAALTTLSRLGYAIVPKVATKEMVKEIAAHVPFLTKETINAAIATGDVLKERP